MENKLFLLAIVSFLLIGIQFSSAVTSCTNGIYYPSANVLQVDNTGSGIKTCQADEVITGVLLDNVGDRHVDTLTCSKTYYNNASMFNASKTTTINLTKEAEWSCPINYVVDGGYYQDYQDAGDDGFRTIQCKALVKGLGIDYSQAKVIGFAGCGDKFCSGQIPTGYVAYGVSNRITSGEFGHYLAGFWVAPLLPSKNQAPAECPIYESPECSGTCTNGAIKISGKKRFSENLTCMFNEAMTGIENIGSLNNFLFRDAQCTTLSEEIKNSQKPTTTVILTTTGKYSCQNNSIVYGLQRGMFDSPPVQGVPYCAIDKMYCAPLKDKYNLTSERKINMTPISSGYCANDEVMVGIDYKQIDAMKEQQVQAIYCAKLNKTCPDCRIPVCGNGILEKGEQCDYANSTNGSCSANCQIIPTCVNNAVGLSLVSDSSTTASISPLFVNTHSAIATYDQNPGWTANIVGAKWIWDSYYVSGPTTNQTTKFTRTFTLPLNINTTNASIKIGADNTYSCKLNNITFGTDNNPINYIANSTDTYNLSALVVPGLNVLTCTVTNIGLLTGTALNNPAGLLYNLTLNSSCSSNNTCYTRLKDIPANCTGGNLTLNTDLVTWDNCRHIICQNGSNMLNVTACEKPDEINPTSFEMYLTNKTGSGIKICLGNVCIEDNGFATQNFPICNGTNITNVCGDGILNQTAEQCDDGNTNNTDNCSNTCTVNHNDNPFCGDGILNQITETCDDGNMNNTDSCSNTCQINNKCSDNLTDVPAVCTGGNIIVNTNLITWDNCRHVTCVNGTNFLNVTACEKPGELNPTSFEMYLTNQSGNGITICLANACLGGDKTFAVQTLPTCNGTNVTSVCGDGILNRTTEACDDGNMNNGDGCSATCTIENNNPVCGNHVVEDGEACDDGNMNNTDNCSNTCHINNNNNNSSCGDGILNQNTEQCDDGNTNNVDNCSNTCQINHNDNPFCGDGIKEVWEQCDDHNNNNGDGCNSDCNLESNNPVCGNGVVESGEACDDGNTNNLDSCSNTCHINQNNTCYPNLTDIPANCTGGNIVWNTNLVTFDNCRHITCQNGSNFLNITACEKPDEINPTSFEMYLTNQSGNGITICLANACLGGDKTFAVQTLPTCNNTNVTNTTYQCSDGIDNDQDGYTDYPSDSGCSSLIDNSESNGNDQTPVCGNQILESGESCDDGNLVNDDSCSNTCQITTNTTYQCSDGIDNDQDGSIDLADPGCSSLTDNNETNTNDNTYQCNDGIDNDNDNHIDYPSDSGCSSLTDDTERSSSGGGSSDSSCDEKWICTQFEQCNDGVQIRDCSDKNKCGTTHDKPSLVQSCNDLGNTQKLNNLLIGNNSLNGISQSGYDSTSGSFPGYLIILIVLIILLMIIIFAIVLYRTFY